MRKGEENQRQPMLKKALSILYGSRIVKDTAFVFSSKAGTMVLGFLGTVIVVRELGPSNFGLYATALAFIPLVAGICDFGLTTSVIKFGSLYLKEDERKAKILFKIVGKQKLIISLLVPALGFLLTNTIAVHIYRKPELIYPLRISMFCIMLNIIFTYLETIIQTRQQFLNYSIITLAASVMKVVSILTLFFIWKALTLENMMLLQVGIGLFSIFICNCFLDRDFLFEKYSSEERKSIVWDVFNFSKWVMISTLCFSVARRLDIVMLNYYVDSSLVGVYACALQLISPLMLLKGSMHNVLLPKVSRITSYAGYMNYAKKFTVLIVLFCLCFIPVIIFARPMIEFIFGTKYSESAYIFQILIVRMAFILILNPLHMIAYSAGHPWIISIKDILALVINFGANISLIPLMGVAGAAYGALVTTVIGGLIPIVYIYYHIMLPIKGARMARENMA